MNVPSVLFGRRAFALAACLVLSVSMSVSAAPPVAGPNVNMVSGTKWPEGDPFLTKQNEPSIARVVAQSAAPARGLERLPPRPGRDRRRARRSRSLDPDLQVHRRRRDVARDAARRLPDQHPGVQRQSRGSRPRCARSNPNFGADPTVRPGPYGTFFLSFIAGTRDTSANGVVAVQRFVDKNNDIQRATDVRGCTAGTPGCAPVYVPDGCTGRAPGCTLKGYVKIKSAEDPILPDVLNIIDVGTPGQGKDKPWIVVDVGRRSWNAGKTCELLSWTKSRAGRRRQRRGDGRRVQRLRLLRQFHGQQQQARTSTSRRRATAARPSASRSRSASALRGEPGHEQCHRSADRRRSTSSGAISIATPTQILMNKSTDGGADVGQGRSVVAHVQSLRPGRDRRVVPHARLSERRRVGRQERRESRARRVVAAQGRAGGDGAATRARRPIRRTATRASSSRPPPTAAQTFGAPKAVDGQRRAVPSNPGQPDRPRPPGAGVADVRRRQAARHVARPAAGPHAKACWSARPARPART